MRGFTQASEWPAQSLGRHFIALLYAITLPQVDAQLQADTTPGTFPVHVTTSAVYMHADLIDDHFNPHSLLAAFLVDAKMPAGRLHACCTVLSRLLLLGVAPSAHSCLLVIVPCTTLAE